jgi:RsiW-degrading membrane proteinase PrsW (M82 family)
VYAANPAEHLYHPSVISTLFPHLSPRRTLQTRWLLFVLAAAVFLIGLGRLVPLSIVLAALLVPALYLLYFYQVQLYEDEPLRVLGATFLLSALLGLVMSAAFYRAILSQHRVGFGPMPSYALLVGVALPLLGQALMLVGPLMLYFTRPRFDDVLDGLAFGAASGLGFSATQSITYAWQLILGPFQQAGADYDWALLTIRIALLVPLVNAATTGLLCAALWIERDRDAEARREAGPLVSLAAAVVIAALGQVVPALGSTLKGGPVLTLVWYAATLIVLLLLVRHVLHIGLLEKARKLGHGASLRCPHCHHLIGDVSFCPHCGLAMRATSKRARRHARQGQGQSEGQEQTGA